MNPIVILGVTQILAWGSSFYIPAVLAGPIAAETGWPLAWIIGGASVGLLTAGLVSRGVGHAIHRLGGRPVLVTSSLLFALGLTILSQAHHLAVFYIAWVVLGLGMGAGLYDAAFSTLGRIFGDAARRPITLLTLWGGFASTVAWPISAYLSDAVGWRYTCLFYVAAHLVLGLPLHIFALPREGRLPAPLPAASDAASARAPARGGLFLVLATAITLGAALVSITHIHLLTILQAQGVALAAAVALGALVGPSQVGARVIEMVLGSRYHPIWTLAASSAAMAAGLALLWLAPAIVVVAIVVYGGGVGIQSIARGTVPLAIYGKERYALIIGRIAMPALIVQAIAPTLAALLIDAAGVPATLGVLTGIAMTTIVLVIAVRWLARPAT